MQDSSLAGNPFVHLNVDSIAIADCYPYLSLVGSCEQQWAQRFTLDHKKQEFLAIWGYVRKRLSDFLGIPIEQLQFARTEIGKPYLVAPTAAIHLPFNLTHTKEIVGLCYGHHYQVVGIDIETPRILEDMLAISQRFFAQQEFEFLKRLPQDLQQHYFFKYWVIKEALLKASGLGISFGLEKVFIKNIQQDFGQISITNDHQSQLYHWQFQQPHHHSYMQAVAVA